jgi:hypothetical protein
MFSPATTIGITLSLVASSLICLLGILKLLLEIPLQPMRIWQGAPGGSTILTTHREPKLPVVSKQGLVGSSILDCAILVVSKAVAM